MPSYIKIHSRTSLIKNTKIKFSYYVFAICSKVPYLLKLSFHNNEAKLILNYFSLLLITSILPLLKKRNFMVQWLHRWHCCNKGKLRQALTRQLNSGKKDQTSLFFISNPSQFSANCFPWTIGIKCQFTNHHCWQVLSTLVPLIAEKSNFSVRSVGTSLHWLVMD